MKLDGISKQSVLESLDIEDNLMSIFQSGEGIGQSGSFFFYTKDQKFVIKTMRRNEK